MTSDTTTDTSGGDEARRRSLSSVAPGAVHETTRMRARAPIQQVRGKHKGKGVGRPWTNVHELAKQHSVAAFKQLVELTRCDNPCVRFGASRVVLELDVGKVPAIIEHRRAPGARPAKGKHAQELKIRITHFNKEGKGSGTET